MVRSMNLTVGTLPGQAVQLQNSDTEQVTDSLALARGQSLSDSVGVTDSVGVEFTPGSSTMLLNADFESIPANSSTAVTIANARTALGDSDFGGSSTVARSFIVDTPEQGHVWEQRFAADTYSTGAGIAAFLDGPLAAAQPLDEAEVKYAIRFLGTGFDWGWGGKLPGLGGINGLASGPGEPTGGNGPTDNGWSGRNMWDAPGSNVTNMSPDEGLCYMYHPDQSGAYGDDLLWGRGFVANQWHTVRVHYKMNTPGVHDGVLEAFLDGSRRINRTDFLYRNRSDVHINYLYWHMFYGGATINWGPGIDTAIQIGYIQIFTP